MVSIVDWMNGTVINTVNEKKGKRENSRVIKNARRYLSVDICARESLPFTGFFRCRWMKHSRTRAYFRSRSWPLRFRWSPTGANPQFRYNFVIKANFEVTVQRNIILVIFFYFIRITNRYKINIKLLKNKKKSQEFIRFL